MRKILTLIAALSLVASLAVGGSIAYLQDTAMETNVMTLGKVDIELHETLRDGVTDYEDGLPLNPAVGLVVDADNDGYLDHNQVIDKVVTIENTGDSDAYVRLIFAFEGNSYSSDKIVKVKNDTDWDWKTAGTMTYNGNTYELVVATPKTNPLGSVMTTPPSLKQVYMTAEGTNEDLAAAGGADSELEILVAAQAVQTAGFANPTSAFVAAFGAITSTNNPWIGRDANNDPVVVNNAAELNAAAKNGGKIIFGQDITGPATITQMEGKNVVIDGDGHKFTGVMTVFGNGRQAGAETLNIKNIDFVAAAGAGSSIVSPDRTVNNKYSYAHNVTVENCTFTDPDGDVNCAAIRHEDGGDKNWVVKNCTVDSTMHSLLQVNNVEGKLTIDKCTVSSKNGANLNSCTNVEMSNCNFDVQGYAVRFGVSSGGNLGTPKTYLIKDSTLKSANDEGDAVIMFRASAVDANLTLDKTTLIGTPDISGNTTDTIITKK